MKYAPHPWVTAVHHRFVDPDHLLLYVDLSSKGKYAELDAEEILPDGALTLFLVGRKGDIPQPLTIHTRLCGEWKVMMRQASRYTIHLLLVRTETRIRDDYWRGVQPDATCAT